MKKLFFIVLMLATVSGVTAQNNKANKVIKTKTGNFHVWTEGVKAPKTKTGFAEYEEIAVKKPANTTMGKTNVSRPVNQKRNGFNGAMADLDKAVKPKNITQPVNANRNNFQTTSEDLQQIRKPVSKRVVTKQPGQ